MKIAIYVEGVTEACFVYQLIGEHYDWNWNSFRLECLNLDPKEASGDLRDYGVDDASDYYLIYDSCSESAVSSDIKDRIQRHVEEGYDKVIGLRDVYGGIYRALYPRQFNEESIASFIKDMRDALSTYDLKGLTRLCFAIMEIEAWLLAMSDVFQRIDPRLDANWLNEKVGVDVNADPENTFLHPYSNFEEIYKSIARPYGKHWTAIKELIFKIKKEDFDSLYKSGKCNSYREFHDTLFE